MSIGYRSIDELSHGRDSHDRLVLVDGPDRAAHGGRQRRRVALAAHDERHQRVHPVPLRHRHIDRVRLPQIERRLLHVADDTDDRVPIAFWRSETKPLADRVATSELAPGERFVDEHRARRARPIVRIEQAATAKWNAHRLDVAWCDGIAKRGPIFFRASIALEMDAVRVDVTAEGQERGEGCRGNAWHGADRVERIGVKAISGAVRHGRRRRFRPFRLESLP